MKGKAFIQPEDQNGSGIAPVLLCDITNYSLGVRSHYGTEGAVGESGVTVEVVMKNTIIPLEKTFKITYPSLH